MPFTGTGGFNLVSGNPVVTGTAISSTVQNNTMSDFANGFANCITRDGQSPPTANLPMGGQRHTGASAATGTGEYLTYGTAANVTNLTVTGNTQLGDAAGDTLVINPNAVTWGAGGVTHTGSHTFPNVAVTGVSSHAGGVSVGNAVQLSNLILSWYEERITFTPTIIGSTTSGVGTYSLQLGKATRIGNRVDGHVKLIWTAHTGTGNVQIGLGTLTYFPSTTGQISIGADITNDLFRKLQMGTSSPWPVTTAAGAGYAVVAAGNLAFNFTFFMS